MEKSLDKKVCHGKQFSAVSQSIMEKFVSAVTEKFLRFSAHRWRVSSGWRKKSWRSLPWYPYMKTFKWRIQNRHSHIFLKASWEFLWPSWKNFFSAVTENFSAVTEKCFRPSRIFSWPLQKKSAVTEKFVNCFHSRKYRFLEGTLASRRPLKGGLACIDPYRTYISI